MATDANDLESEQPGGEPTAPGLDDEEMATELTQGDLVAAEATLPPPRRARTTSLPPPVPQARRTRSRTSGIPAPLPRPDLALESPTVLENLLRSAAPSWEARLFDLEQRSQTAEDRGDQKLLAFYSYEAGHVLHRELGDAAQAAKAYGRTLKADPSLRANLWAVRRVFAERGMWGNLTKLCAAETELARSPSESAELWVEQGRVFENKLKNPAEARASYERALSVEQGCVAALLGLERVAAPDRDANVLVRTWRGLCDATEEPARKQAYLLDLADVFSRDLGDLSRARATLREAAELCPNSFVPWLELELCAGKQNDAASMMLALERQIALLERGVDSTEDQRRQRAYDIAILRRRLGRVAEILAGDSERAWVEYAKAADDAPEATVGRFDLAELAEKNGRYEELADLTAAWALKEADPAQALDISLRRAQALLKSGRHDEAKKLLAKLQTAAPHYLPVLTLREHLALLTKDDRELANVWATMGRALLAGQLFGVGANQPPAFDREAAARYLVAAGDLVANLGDAEGALAHFQEASAAAPAAEAATDALVSALTASDRLAEALDLSSRVAPSSDLEFLVFLCVLSGDSVRLADTLAKWSQRDPDNLLPWFWQEVVLEELGRHEQRGEVLSRLAELTSDSKVRQTLWCESARVAEFELDNPERAIELFERALEQSPDNGVARGALAALYARTERWQKLADFLKERSSDSEKTAALAVVAHLLASKLERPDEAAELWREIVDRDPYDHGAWRTWLDCLRQRAWTQTGAAAVRPLCDALEQLIATEEGTGSVDSLVELGLARERMADRVGAIDVYRRAAAKGSRLAAVGLCELGYERRDAEVAAKGFEILAQVLTAANRERLWEDAGWLHLLARSDVEAAGVAFGNALANGSSVNLGRVLVSAARGQPAETLKAWSTLGRDSRDVSLGAAALARAAFYAMSLGDQAQAERCLVEAIEKQPESEEIAVFLTDWYGSVSARGEGPAEPATVRAYANACRIRAGISDSEVERRAWNVERAEALLRSGQVREAGLLATEMVAANPTDAAALAVLREVCMATGDRSGGAEVSAELARVLTDRDSQLECLREAAEIFDQELGDPERALIEYRRILALEPEAPEFSRAREILFGRDDPGGLFELLSDRLNSTTREGEKVSLLLVRAKLRRGFGDAIGSDNDLALALNSNSKDPEALWELAALALERDQRPRAIDFLRQYVASSSGTRRERGVKRLADLLESEGDFAAAAVELGRLEDKTPKMREREVQALTQARQFEQAAQALAELRDARTDTHQKYDDEIRLAEVCLKNLSDSQRAITAYRRAFEIDRLEPTAVMAMAELSGADAAAVVREHAYALRSAIAATPSDLSLYRRLLWATNTLADGGSDLVEAAESALSALLGGDDLEIGPPHDNRRLGGALGDSEWRRLCSPAFLGPTLDIWRLIGPAVAAIRMADPVWATTRMSRIKQREVEKRYPTVEAVAKLFEIAEYDCYLTPGDACIAHASSAATPGLCLSEPVANAATSQARFWLGQAAFLVKSNTGTAHELSVEELTWYFAAAAALAEAEVPAQLLSGFSTNPDAVKERTVRLDRELGRRDRKALRQGRDLFAHLDSIATWREAIEISAARAGLLISGDLPAAFAAVLGSEWRGLARESGLAHQLLSWMVSADHLALKNQLTRSRA